MAGEHTFIRSALPTELDVAGSFCHPALYPVAPSLIALPLLLFYHVLLSGIIICVRT